MLIALLILAAAPPIAGDSLPSPGRPFGALLGESTLVFTGWPAAHGVDGPCGKARGSWRVGKVIKGDKSLAGKEVPVYGALPLNLEPRSMMMFLKGQAECPELVAQQEIGAETIIRAAARDTDCALQLQAIDQVLRGLATDCDSDSDCAAYTLHPNSCERPRPYARRVQSGLPAFWGPLASRARSACERDWSKQSACAPASMPVHCDQHRCLEGPSPSSAPPLARATVGEGCAPTDGPAMNITVQPLGADFPSIGVTWWGEDRPRRGSAGEYSLDGEPKAGRGFGATYCSFQGGCTVVHQLRLHLKLGADGKGELELEAETSNGEKLRASVPAEIGPVQRVRCG